MNININLGNFGATAPRTVANTFSIEKLIHYSKEPMKEFETVLNKEQTDHFKPKGLWISVGTAWKDWCESEQWGLDGLKYSYEVILDFKKIVIINSIRIFELFEMAYPFIYYFDKREKYIDWKRVCRDFYGIIISPYLWKKRYSSIWYYGWDCASGCIWNKKAIKEIKLL